MALITCTHVDLAYEGRKVAEDISFAVEAGDYLCIVGENGSGKSTLLKAILGLHAPAAGEIAYGEGLTRGQIGYLPQRTQAQKDFPASCMEVVLSGALAGRRWRPFYTKVDKARAAANMEKLGVVDIKNKSFRELSGGQQQRVLLARAMTAASRVLVLDEPVSGLDPLASAELYRDIKTLNNSGIAILMVSHDIQSALDQGKRVLHLGHRVQFLGTTAEYRASDLGKGFSGGGKND